MNTALIKYNIAKKGLTNYEAAEKMGVAQERFSSIINGKTNPTLKTLKRLANTLDMKISDVIGEE